MIGAVIKAVEQAGRAILDVRQRGFSVTQKGRHGPVTDADRAADGILKAALLDIEPCAWLSEETTDDRRRLDANRVWVVDPLDGTKEFVEGIPEYAVAVGLVERGRPILGVIHNPNTRDTFSAEAEAGAFLNGEPIRIVEGSALLASRSEIRRAEFSAFEDDWDVRPVGSIAYKLGLVAAGAGGATLSRGPKWEWDVCAGSVIVAEAGGIAVDIFGESFTFNRSFPKVRGVLAGAPKTVNRLLRRLATVGPSDRMQELIP